MWLRSQALVREAKLAGRLNYPGIVTIHDVFELGELVSVTMEYIFLGLAEGFLLAGGEFCQGVFDLIQLLGPPPRKLAKPPTAPPIPITVPMNPRIGMVQRNTRTRV